MNVLSLFDGISCGKLALERANISVTNYFASEIDKNAIRVSSENHDDIIRVGDVSNLDPHSLPKIDLLLGGSPCQGFSFVGKNKGFDDTRSHLFFHYVMLLNELKPKYFLFENTPMKRYNQDVISNELSVSPVTINSNLFSAQNRTRLYWTNIPILPITDSGVYWKDIRQYNVDRKFYYNQKNMDLIARIQKNPRRVFKLYDDNSEKFFTITASFAKGLSTFRFFGIKEEDGIRFITPVECERLQTLPDNYTDSIPKTHRYKVIGNAWTVDVISHIIRGIYKH